MNSIINITLVGFFVGMVGTGLGGIIIGLSIALHNLPEGLAVGSSFMAKENMGISLAIIMLIHNIPEGLAMATPLKIGEYPNWKIVLITFLAGLPTGIGTFLGAYLGNISNTFIGFCLALAGGCMLYIICDDLLPNAKSLYGGKSINISILTGIFLGLLMIVYL